MKFVCPEIETVFDFDNGQFNSLVIESQDMFVRLLSDLSAQMEGLDGTCILSDKNVPVSFSKRAALLDVFVPFELNRKPLLGKILAALEQMANNAEHFEVSASVLASVERMLDSLILDIPCELVYTNISIGALLKAAAPQLNADNATLAEKILYYMDLVTQFDCERLFVMINVRSYMNDEDMQLFAQTIVTHNYQVLDIETSERKRLDGEFRVLIDEDMCEII